jgi:1,4-alpha-glucan branching enzyme
MEYKIFEYDPYLCNYKDHILQRMENYAAKKNELVGKGGELSEFANAHEYFGFHKTENGWFYREWAPAADALYLTGDMIGWKMPGIPLKALKNGVFEVFHTIIYAAVIKIITEGCR